MTGYDVHRLTPSGGSITHVQGTIETDGPWLIVRDAAGTAIRALPAHAVYDVTPCKGGVDCADLRR